MRYRVVFRERTDAEGHATERPSEYLDAQLSDGIVLDASMVERDQPAGLHTESMDEDDSFLSVQTEAWDYDVADDRKDDFVAALRNSEVVVEYEELGDEDSVSAV
jgi:hypothetical protein